MHRSDEEQCVSILIFDDEFHLLKNILLPDEITNIQGVSWNGDGQSIWFTDTKAIYLIGMDGTVYKEIELEEYSQYRPNGLLYDERDSTLWTLCAENYLLHIDQSGNVLKAVECNFLDQDQICFDEDFNIYFTTGADYVGADNFIGKIDIESGQTKIIYRCRKSYAIEGIVIKDHHLLVANDGIYHEGKISKNYVAVYNDISIDTMDEKSIYD